jgi:diguanylate cyclase (GGDEF)-like protein
MRAVRLSIQSSRILLATENSVQAITALADQVHPAFLAVDSIQTMYSEEVSSVPGSITQVRESTSLLVNLAKTTGLPIILIVDEIKLETLLAKAELVDDFVSLHTEVEEIILRIEYAFKRIERISDNNPLTGLPGNTSIEQAIKEFMHSSEPYAICYADIDNFKAYNDRYGFTRGDEIIKNLARIIVNTVKEFCPQKSFVGHVGGDDFVFIVPLEKAEEITKEILRRFNLLVKNFIDPEDLEKGYFISKDRQGNIKKFSFPSVSIALIPVYQGKFKHYGEIIQRAAEVKKLAKKISGNSYFIDRRK